MLNAVRIEQFRLIYLGFLKDRAYDFTEETFEDMHGVLKIELDNIRKSLKLGKKEYGNQLIFNKIKKAATQYDWSRTQYNIKRASFDLSEYEEAPINHGVALNVYVGLDKRQLVGIASVRVDGKQVHVTAKITNKIYALNRKLFSKLTTGLGYHHVKGSTIHLTDIYFN